MRIVIPSTTAALAVAAALAWPTAASALTDLVVNVDCASGGRINQALSRPALFDRRLVVAVSGTCNENVVIERDDVTIRAQSTGGGVSGADPAKSAILINGARRVTLEGLSVVGGLHGVHVTGGAAATIRSSTVGTAARVGVLVDSGASAVIDGSTIDNNGETGVAAVGAGVTITDSIVRLNRLYGVSASRTGLAILGKIDGAGNICCGNTIEDNTFDGVLVADSAVAYLFSNKILRNGTGNGRWGILAVRQSSVVLRGGNLVSNNGSATGGGGGVFARQSTINTGPGDTPVIPSTNEISGNRNGILAEHNSSLDLRGGLSVTGNTVNGVSLTYGTLLRTQGSNISGNTFNGIQATRSSSVEFLSGPGTTINVVSGNGQSGLFCDPESRYNGNGNVTGITGNLGVGGNLNCTAF